MRKLVFSLVAMLGLAATSQAGPVIVNSNPGTLNTTSAITGSATTGTDMVGMQVTAFFTNGTSQTLGWTAAGGGGVTGTGWSLAVSGDTFSSNWTLRNTAAAGGLGITRVLIDAGPGNTVFDRSSPSFGTTGSFSGQDFSESVGSPFPITATYWDLVALTNNPPVGDLFRTLDIQFTGAGGLTAGSQILFRADTDNAATAVTVVPEPISMVVFGSLVVGGVVAVRRRMSKAAA